MHIFKAVTSGDKTSMLLVNRGKHFVQDDHMQAFVIECQIPEMFPFLSYFRIIKCTTIYNLDVKKTPQWTQFKNLKWIKENAGKAYSNVQDISF